MLKVSTRILSTYLYHHSSSLPARASSLSPYIARPPSNLVSPIFHPTRTFKMSAPVDANLHKDDVTGEMVSKSCVGVSIFPSPTARLFPGGKLYDMSLCPALGCCELD